MNLPLAWVKPHGAFRYTARSGTLEDYCFCSCVYTLNPEAVLHMSARARLMALTCTSCANMMCAHIRSICQQFCVPCMEACAAFTRRLTDRIQVAVSRVADVADTLSGEVSVSN